MLPTNRRSFLKRTLTLPLIAATAASTSAAQTPVLQPARKGGAVHREQDVLRHGHDQLVAIVDDADTGPQLLAQLGLLPIQVIADRGPEAGPQHTADHGVLQPFIAIAARDCAQHSANPGADQRTLLGISGTLPG